MEVKDLNIGPKVANKGANANGRMSAVELNEIVGTVNGHADNIRSLDAAIGALKADGMSLSVTGGGTFFVGDTAQVTITAKTSMTPDKLQLTSGGAVIASVDKAMTLSKTFSLTINATITASASLNGVVKTASTNVSFVVPSYVGSGISPESIVKSSNRIVSVAGEHTVPVASGGKIYIVTQATLKSITYSGFDLPVAKTTKNIGGTNYNVYESAALVSDSYKIIITV